MENRLTYLFIILLGGIFYSCSPRNISTRYYEENKIVLDRIEQTYSKLYQQKPFTVAFTDKDFETTSLEFITDSLIYIYQFGYNEPRLKDSLVKFGLDAPKVLTMMDEMRSIRCTWINNFDYYVDGKKKSSVFLSIKPVGISGLFSNKKYYIITYFSQNQYYDKEGRLVNNRRQRQLQKINGEVFKRINDKVSYTVSSQYR